MFPDGTIGLFAGAILLGAIHGIEPGHGWPVAASYALDQSNKWLYGFAASFILGVGHLVSSIAMVAVFFYAKAYFNLTQVNEPIQLVEGVSIGGPVSLVAGGLLILLGIREYTHGHAHSHGGDEHGHEHTRGHEKGEHVAPRRFVTSVYALPPSARSHDYHAAHSSSNDGWLARITQALPFGGGHSHDHESMDEPTDRGLLGIAWFAFLLGFAHEEEFEIIALCAGSDYCLELMSAYAVTVIVGIVGLTMLLIAGYEQYEEEVEKYTPYLPMLSAAVLVLMGAGFILGLF
ncbi:hypothetical protein [Halomarina ordinaria]|uniref:Nickel/cobalt efflux system n=1 Tax=Halomarina ordinaria TaxID=3033939 RepID=A0ABD5UGB1_9EURY|nr:hypothetical protein [Halomarina sp. PSRA2]